jgi:hypothetical protein
MSVAAQQTKFSLSGGLRANPSRQHILALALLWTIILAASSILALRQATYPDAEKNLRAYQQFWYPWENYPLLRLPFIDAAFQDVFVLPSNDQWIWAIADGGLILHSQNAGLSWTRQAIHPPSTSIKAAPKAQLLHWQLWAEAVAMDAPAANAIKEPDAKQLYEQKLYEQKRAMEPTRKAAPQQQAQQPPEPSATLTESNKLNNQNINPVVSNTPGDLQRIYFVDANTGWISTDNNIYLVTTDGGKNWQSQLLLPPIALQQPRLGLEGRTYLQWRVGALQQLEFSEDDGETWLLRTRNTATNQRWLQTHADWRQQQNQLQIKKGEAWITPTYHRYPAPWLWLVSLLLAMSFIEILRRLGVVQILPPTVADLLASDRPLKPGDPDPLRFGVIARSLSRFMRNPNTEPPLTIAITGEWGTGKSSLMNLLYHDLRTYGFTPVWFNAWHHQKGEQLLAALYANIRQQAIPGWWRFSGGVPVGFLFRLRLLHQRGRRNWAMFLALCVALTAALSYLLTHPVQWQSLQFQTFLGVLTTLASDQEMQSQVLVALIGIVPSAAALLRTVRAFGIDPMKLITFAGADGGSKIDPTARQKFAKEFCDVTSSLELGRMVIFIDDLDRCSQENVLDIMEAMNFLSVSGQCYIVIGMAEKWVKTCIGLGFKAMAEETFVEDGRSDLLQRQAFADQYLEKMINISVPVPGLQADDSERLLAVQPLLDHLSSQKTIGKRLQHLYQRYQVVVVLLLAVALGTFLGVNDQSLAKFSAWLTPTAQPLRQNQATSPAGNAPANNSLSTNITGVDTALLDQALQQQGAWLVYYPWWLGLIILLAWSTLLTRQSQRIVPDSADFRAALSLWQPWITLQRQTPRAIKRFLNRVRYHAMRVRTEIEEHRVSDDLAMNEADLVALSAIYALAPEWLENTDHFQQLANQQLHELLAIKFPHDKAVNVRYSVLEQTLARTLNKHKEKFGDAIFTQPLLRQRFLLGLARESGR